MTYATQQNMVDRFGEQELIDLTDRAVPPAGAIDPVVLGKALDDASSDIDGFLAGRYALPLTKVPKVLERLACDIARYYLYENRVTDIVADRHKQALSYLRDVGTGKLNLDRDDQGESAAGSTGPATSAPDRVFTAETLGDF